MRYLRFLSIAGAAFALVFTTGLSAAAGDLDKTFDGDGKVLTDFAGSDRAYSVAVQSDGKVVVAGETFAGQDGSIALARYAVNGSLDSTFDADGKVRTDFSSLSSEGANSLVIQSDGKIVVAGGAFIPGSGTGTDFALARYNTDGTLDAGFDGDGKLTTDFAATIDHAVSIAVQQDGKLIVAGLSRSYGVGARYHFAVARYNADGSLDGSFDGDGKAVTGISEGSSDYAATVVVQADGKILLGGTTETDHQSSAVLVRYMPDGSLDGSFDGDGKVVVTSPTSQIWDLALQRDGKVVTAGPPSLGVTRFNADGSVDTAFGDLGHASIPNSSQGLAVAIQRDGKIIAAGPTGYPSDFTLARFAPGGTLDDSLAGGVVSTDVAGPQLSDIPYDIAVAPDGKIVLAGVSGPPNGAGPDDFAVVRYLAAPPPCKVPNVRGKRLATAKASIKKARCTVGKVTRKPSKRVKKGRVLSQSPRAGAIVPSGGKVNLVVSKGRKR